MSSNRVEPAYIPKNERNEDLAKKAEILLDSFEWIATAGKSDKAAGARVFVLFGIQLTLALILVFVPTLLFGERMNELTFAEKEVASIARHIVRSSVIIGGGWAFYVIAMCLLASIPYFIKIASRRDKLMSSRTMNFLNGQSEVSPYISLFLGALVASLCVKNFYPSTLAPAEAISKLASSNALKPDVQDITQGLVTETAGIYKIITHYNTLFPLVVHVLFIALFVLLIEKTVLQIIAVSYRSDSTAGRFTSNVVALKLIKRLFRAKIDQTLLLADRNIGKEFDEDVAKMVFDAMVPEESGKLLTVDDLKEILSEEQATILFGLLDIAQNGDMTRQEFIEAVKAVFGESNALENLIKDQDNIISKVDSVLLFGVYSLDVALALSYLGVSFTNLAVGMGLLLLGAVAFFDDAVKKLVKSLVFVLITHPYDAGDRIVLDDEVYIINSVGLWTTTMEAPGALQTVVINAALFDKKISNFRRSPSENEVMEFLCLPSTVTEESLASLKEDCLAFLREKRRDFQDNLVVESVDYIDHERMKICFKIFHRQNFQDDDAKAERSAMFLLHAKDAFLRHGFVFSPALQKVLVAHL
jgi:small-conductance mechanosensitive channel